MKLTIPPLVLRLLLGFTLLFYAAIGGLFFAYAVSIMPGLEKLGPQGAIAAMQSINSAVRNPVFALAFFGAPVLAMSGAALCLLDIKRKAALFLLLAAFVYGAGVFLPTLLVHVPMNFALSQVELPVEAERAATLWADYAGPWRFWNAIRLIFCATSLLLVGSAIFSAGKRSAKAK